MWATTGMPARDIWRTSGAKDESTSSFTQSAMPSVMKRPALRTPSASLAW